MAAKDYIWGNKHPETAPNQYKWHPLRPGPMKKKSFQQIMEAWRAFLNKKLDKNL